MINKDIKKNGPIILIGLMGAGKTTIGKKLAQYLSIPFIDSDHEIEKTAGCTITDIFEQYGEAEFRRVEHEVIRRLIKQSSVVIATGGGAFMHAKTRQLLKEQATTIWLHCNVDTLLERISHHTHRPLLNSSNKREILSDLITTRYPVYAEADYIIPCHDNKIETTLTQILSILEQAKKMRTLPVTLSNTQYNVLIGPNLLQQAGTLLTPLLSQKKVFIVVDENVASFHLQTLTNSLTLSQIEYETILIPPGENTKSFKYYEQVVNTLLEKNVERQTPVIALGGGVTGDLSGFAAATVLRGLPFIQIPTTLLSQVDSSVGGKTGINTPTGKNLLGAFYQPQIVIADTHTLNTLPQRELLAGYAEIVKAGLIDDIELFEWCENNGEKILSKESHYLDEAVERACAFKARIIKNDEFEQHSKGRNLLNLGHSLGHTLEAELGYDGRILHGEAVALGCCLIFKLCTSMGICPQEDTDRVLHHFKSVGLPTSIRDLSFPLQASSLLRHLQHDKKVKNTKVLFILVNGIGKTFTSQDVREEDLLKLLMNDGCI
ncbi:3-dehydroquinate synthase [Commensalibacter papalotli (ex Botero et al. 2024)]|uniref:Multifunctional fusion protein n=1 Tax=Commensalibacter papalotli (ex Botero et al. 2024) TaxID=2972766 RepID=A0ABM9HN87_9PROT|nr:3-dehydroquinate synthase [Commensalibacter papalotli (ex Botero et al. 2024)]CAI3936271.1 3-dehydroquinate synthetase (AroB) (PDB:3ZOK) [Commensalibacter papalotli (ex Botero et al. 2024)]CAI3939404.1 3-dehydroquinate synthetase (AroB) (PDB:3ZOK) [Commensalibacter papalotli (ex Botero et al. 2024)]